MPELVFTVARFGLLILLWVFVFVVARAIRRDVFTSTTGSAVAHPPVSQRQSAKPQQQQAATSRPARELMVVEGALRGTRIPLGTAVITIGRSPDSTLIVNDDYASTRHAQLVPRRGQWILEDVGSTNGTYLGRAKVTGPTPVPLGVPIRIGRTSIELRP